MDSAWQGKSILKAIEKVAGDYSFLSDRNGEMPVIANPALSNDEILIKLRRMTATATIKRRGEG